MLVRIIYCARGTPHTEHSILGKTTLVTFIKKSAPVAPDAMVLFYLCYQVRETSRSVQEMALCALIAQILRKKTSLVAYLYEEYVQKAEVPSMPLLKTLLRQLLQALPSSYIIIDGLDECEANDAQQLLLGLDTALSLRDMDESSPPEAKIMICSQETPAIAKRLRKEPTLTLSDEQSQIERDVRVYCRSRIEELHEDFGDAVKDEISAQIVAKANGMFLWVRFVMDALQHQESLYDLKETIDSLPTGLKDVYALILGRLHKHASTRDRERMKAIFGWLAVGYRSLKSWELCDALVLSTADRALNRDTQLNERILDICKPFTEEVQDGSIAFVHSSVKDYLLDEASGPYLQQRETHYAITSTCFRYLRGCIDFFEDRISAKTYGQVVLGLHSLFPYIHQYWQTHAIQARATQDTNGMRSPPFSDGMAQLLASVPSGSNTLSEHFEINMLASRDSDLLTPLAHYTALQSIISVSLGFLDGANPQYGLGQMIDNSYLCYRDKFEKLLKGDCPYDTIPMGISNLELSRFYERYTKGAFRCSYTDCVRASKGFDTPEERDKHYKSHLKQFKCPHEGCDDVDTSFANQPALRRHVFKYHTMAADMPLPTLRLSHPIKVSGRGKQKSHELKTIDRHDAIVQQADGSLRAALCSAQVIDVCQ